MLPAERFYVSAGNGNIRGISGTCAASADASSLFTADSFQRTVCIGICNGQIAAVILLHTGTVVTAFGCVIPFQLDGHIAVSLGRDGRFSFNRPQPGVIATSAAHIDIHIGDGDLGGLVLLRLDGDGIRGRSRIAVRLVDDGFGGLQFFLYAVFLGDVLVAV